jgi:hypothetical protein
VNDVRTIEQLRDEILARIAEIRAVQAEVIEKMDRLAIRMDRMIAKLEANEEPARER